jgi:hypothetical protein
MKQWLRIRPGLERHEDGARWRSICRIDSSNGEPEMYTGEWLSGPDAESRAEAHAKKIAAEFRAEYGVT